MESVVCTYCENRIDKTHPFCGRCGGRPGGETPAEQAIAGLMLCTRLIAGRVWFGLEEEFAAVKALFEAGNQIDRACAPALEWLVQEIPRLACEADIPRVIEVARLVFGLVRRDAHPEIHAQVARLERFSSTLEGANETWARGPSPSQRKASKWLAEQAELASMTTEQAVESVYETPERWPLVARTVDPETWQQVVWKFEVAQAEHAYAEKNYGAARDLYTAVLTREPECSRAHEGLARVEKRLGRPGLAIDHYRAAVRTSDARVTAWNNLAWALATQGSSDEIDLRKALWAARRAVALAPRSTCWDTLAEVLGRQGDLPAAIAATRESIRLGPHRQACRERMRTLCAALGPAGPPSAVTKGERDIFDDTDFEVDVKSSDGDSDDKAVQVEAASDFDLEVSDTGSEVFAIDEEAVDQNAATAIAPSAFAEDDEEEDECFDSDAASFSESSASSTSYSRSPAQKPKRSLLERAGDMFRGSRHDSNTVEPAGRRESAGAEGNARETSLPVPITDRVSFSLTAPATLEPGASYALDVWAYLGAQRAEVMDLARQSQGSDKIQVKTKSGVIVTRGAVLTVHLAIPTLDVADPEDTICWEGEIGNATFPVSVPRQARPGPHAGTATFYVDQFPLAKLHFALEVGRTTAAVAPLAIEELRSKSAFASYASEDRPEVAGRVQGMRKVAPDLDIFLDFYSLRSGERWEQRLLEEIERRDTLYLFWSQAASRSLWVDREWRTALRLRGVAGIDPIPLASPEEVPPPNELAEHLHFNDWLLAFSRDRRQAGLEGTAPAPEHGSPAIS
jgi:tetratricopeptide (TPR) repeat protein